MNFRRTLSRPPSPQPFFYGVVIFSCRTYHYSNLKGALPAMASASGSFIPVGHRSSLKDRFGSSLAVDAVQDACEKLEKNAVCMGRLRLSGGNDVNSRTENLHPQLKAIMQGCNSNGRLHVSDGFNAENSDDADGSFSFAKANVRLREMHNGFDELHIQNESYLNISVADCRKQVKNCCNGKAQQPHITPESKGDKPAKRAFCKTCEKAQDLCICGRFKSVVHNKVMITILQNPKEKQHAVGSVRVALLGLENVSLVDVPEIYTKESFRIRPKVPGSKRNLAGRGGKKLLLNGGTVPAVRDDKVLSEAEFLQIKNLLINIFKCDSYNQNVLGSSRWPSESSEGRLGLPDGLMHDSRLLDEKAYWVTGNVGCNGYLKEPSTSLGNGSLCNEELESLIPPGVALLYPSDKAVELTNSNHEEEFKAPCHLLVLDGTWSKARRIYFENPWLHNLPHYKLSLPSPSLYEGVRKQPKPGCLSTLESIVYALKVLEPEKGEGLDGLLEVFDSMVEDQRRCKQMKCCVQDCHS